MAVSSSSAPSTSSSSTAVTSSSVKSSSSSAAPSSSSSSITTTSSVGASFASQPAIHTNSSQAAAGNIVYEPVAPGSTVFDYSRPYLVSGDGKTYSLPYQHIFDYGTKTSIILDNFADNDHQNNLGGALATYRGENYTEGGGYWYTFQDKVGATVSNGVDLTLPINGYNIQKAISNNEIRIKMTAGSGDSGFVGFGTNLLFEAAATDLSDLDRIEVTAYGSGTTGVMFDTTDIDRTAAQGWGNYAHKTELTLSSTPTKYTFKASDFAGELYSSIAGQPLTPHLNVASKFFFQVKAGKSIDMRVKKIEFFFNTTSEPLRLAKFKWKDGSAEPHPGYVFDFASVGVPPSLDDTNPYMDWSKATIAPVKAQEQAPTKTSAQLANTGKPNWLHVEGTKLRDTHGHLVRMTGVNWFGFETKNQIPFGLNSRGYKEILAQIKTLGFNTVRIPYSDYTLDASRGVNGTTKLTLDKTDINLTKNSGISATQTPLDLLDAIIAEAKVLGLKVILDSHSRAPDSYLTEGIWNPSYYPEAKWIANWEFMANKYKNEDTVAAFDLKNEPHFDASWGSTDASLNWNSAAERAANAIQAINSNTLIIVEGVEKVQKDAKAINSYWWGGNFQGLLNTPLNITFKNKLVYSPHEYGPEVYIQPWFRDYRFPNNLKYIWEDRFGFIYNKGIGHTLIGEFGIKENLKAGTSGAGTGGSAANKWFEEFLSYMNDHSEGYSWTYWAWNPNSGDTGGILTDDWNTAHDWKMTYLKPYQGPLIGNQNGL